MFELLEYATKHGFTDLTIYRVTDGWQVSSRWRTCAGWRVCKDRFMKPAIEAALKVEKKPESGEDLV